MLFRSQAAPYTASPQEGATAQVPPLYPQTAQQQPYPARNAGPQAIRGSAKPGWVSKFGMGNLQTTFEGHAALGAAAVDKTGFDVDAEFIADIDLRGEVSAITAGGLEYGVGARLRAQLDQGRNGFGGRIGDCPATNPACASVLVGGVPRAVKGHTSQFYTGGPADIEETTVAPEGAYIFLRSSSGDLLLGRDDGSAYLF